MERLPISDVGHALAATAAVTVGNFRGEEFDNAYMQVFDALELNQVTPDAAATQIQQLTQAVLDKDPA